MVGGVGGRERERARARVCVCVCVEGCVCSVCGVVECVYVCVRACVCVGECRCLCNHIAGGWV